MTQHRGAGHPLVGRDDEQLQDPAGRAGPRRGRDGLGRRRPRVHRPARRHRDDDPRPRAPEGGRGDHRAGAQARATSPTSPCTSPACCSPSGCSSSPAGPAGSSSATPAPRPTRRRSRSAGCTGRPEVITAEGAFHGRTMGALALTGQPARPRPSRRCPAACGYVPYGDADALAGAVAEPTAMVLLEPMLGEGGVLPAPAGYLAAAAAAAADAGALFAARRGADRHRPHRHLVRAPGRRPAARPDHPGQGARRRAADGRDARLRRGGRPDDGRRPRLDLRRQPDRRGGRARGARHHPRRGAAGAGQGARAPVHRRHRGPRPPGHQRRPGAGRAAGRRPHRRRRRRAGGAAARRGLPHQRRRARRAAARPAAGAHRRAGRRVRRRPARRPRLVAGDAHDPALPQGRRPQPRPSRPRCSRWPPRSRPTRHTAEAPTPLAGPARGRRPLRQALDPHPGVVLDRASPSSAATRWSSTPAAASSAAASRSRTPPACSTGRSPRSSGAPSARTGSRRWRRSAGCRWSTRSPTSTTRARSWPTCRRCVERKGALAGLTLTYLGDGANNMAHSYLLGGATAGMHVRIGSPEEFQPDPAVLERAAEIAARDRRLGARGPPTRPRPRTAPTCWPPTPGCRWARRTSTRRRIAPFLPYAVDEAALGRAADDAVVLHCLPAYRGKEIAAEVIDGPQSAVWDEAENRLHAQKALLCLAAGAARHDARPLDRAAARQARIAELIGAQPVTLADPAGRAAGRVRHRGHPGHALARPGGARRGQAARLRRRPGVYVLPPENAPAATRAGRAGPAHPAAGRPAHQRRGQRQPRRPAHAAGRRAVPRLGPGPGRPARRPRHHRRRRHSARRRPRSRRRRRPWPTACAHSPSAPPASTPN